MVLVGSLGWESRLKPYKFKYIKGRDYELHPVMGSFLANYLIPKEAFAWLAEYPEAFSSLMYAMADHKDKSGLLSEIVQKADQKQCNACFRW